MLESEQASTDGTLLFYRDGKGYHKGEMICIFLKSLLVFRVYLIIKPAECQDYRLWEDGSIRTEYSVGLNGKQRLPETQVGQGRAGWITDVQTQTEGINSLILQHSQVATIHENLLHIS